MVVIQTIQILALVKSLSVVRLQLAIIFPTE